jgi:hypothetical protein
MLNYQHLIVYAYVYRFSSKFIISTRPSVASKSAIENMYDFMHFCFNLFYFFNFLMLLFLFVGIQDQEAYQSLFLL